jgi:hypothetical protein
VWLLSKAVGKATHSMPAQEMVGKATVVEQRPKQE